MAKRKVDTNPDLDREQAEGDRETVDQTLHRTERTGATPRPDIPGHKQQGVTNRSLEEEREQQSKLPPRGEAKKPTPGGHA
ncbi:MAG: hypothetical protein HYU51_12300 [Candidatus Rokubacteria bacterium]|nr:hypothetical protein [Candidatus Rokubacteria bacterium]